MNFADTFRALTADVKTRVPGHPPLPWQTALYERLVSDRSDNIPAACSLPTGLGKTLVVAVWLIALAKSLQAKGPQRIPRRLVYVVNRRTVVDQTTSEAEKLRAAFQTSPDLQWMRDALGDTLPISTLRGQFADNREWSADPSRPAIIVGTVDMIGSRLLFSGYGVGFKTKPLHAGFLGQDSLVVHDEAHLEPAFQRLLEAIEQEQRDRDFSPLRVMELSATSRGDRKNGGDPFTLTDEDRKHPVVRQRINAAKTISLHKLLDEKKLVEQLAALAKAHEDKDRAVIIFAREVETVEKIAAKLPQNSVLTLTGTMRGYERDRMVANIVFQRFLPERDRVEEVIPQDGTVYLVCTSAGEVGVNLSADELVCDLSTIDSMAQRLGRVNRFGECASTRVDIVHPSKFAEGDAMELRRKLTLDFIKLLEGDGSPKALMVLSEKLGSRIVDAYSPPPTVLPTSDILFDVWAMTSIRGKLPGRPPVEPYLHGLNDYDPPETRVGWREEVWIVQGDLLEKYKAESLLEAYPLKPHELLRDVSSRVFEHLAAMAHRIPEMPAWLIDGDGKVTPFKLKELLKKDSKERIARCTVLLPPKAGGLSVNGILDSTSSKAEDVSDEWRVTSADTRRRRQRLWDNNEPDPEMRLVLTIDRQLDADEDSDDGEEGQPRFWRWFELPKAADNEGSEYANESAAVDWQIHTQNVVDNTTGIVGRLPFLSAEMSHAITIAAQLHDQGKKRLRFQRGIGNFRVDCWFAKSGKRRSRSEPRDPYRHELGSMLDAKLDFDFASLDAEWQDFVLHLIAVHHGRGRPHFPDDEIFDPERPQQEADCAAVEVPRRYARLQRKYGRWGLAYLESLLRAADYRASAEPSEIIQLTE